MRFESFAASDTGQVRQLNEDSLLANDQEGVFLVADGMGGLSKGDIASRIAVETVNRFITESRTEDITWPIKPQDQYSLEENRFLAAVSLANWSVYSEFLKDERNAAMGTTLVGLLVDRQAAIITNIGDSRVYLIRNDTIQQVTEDHSLVMEEVRKGTLTPQEARLHPQRHVINRALGIAESARVDISSIELRQGDLFLLCSDGLSDMLTDEELLAITRTDPAGALSELGNRMVRAANDKGGKDNISLVLVRFYDVGSDA
ncbi:MAG: Stp1/IreP family PP2C-type Ser/Thr phosphatase [Deltaproteobacteria bacterium]|nr:Stp1/IreP family PP2C-type Ser/Thr phosphatase [Deltaproteobacteria bacterium]